MPLSAHNYLMLLQKSITTKEILRSLHYIKFYLG